MILIRTIQQRDNHSFTIQWSDGATHHFKLSELQRLCPCARCVDENTGQRRINPASVDENVRAITIRNVGRYALRIQFTSGCSTGIYDFDMLYSLRKSVS
jgi:DUF971 family protein